MNSRYITVSVDDGYPADSRAADLLQKYGLQATFYIPARNPEHPVMAPSQIRGLSRGFEIGGHTYNHAALKSLPTEKASKEICDGKNWLEDILGEPVVSFCYPQGKFNRETPGLVKQAGFLGGEHAFSTCTLSRGILSCGDLALMLVVTANLFKRVMRC